MEIDINWLAVGVATVAGMAVAYMWYADWSPLAKRWEKHTHVTGGMIKKAPGIKAPIVLLGANFATALVLTMAITVVAAYFKDSSLWLALATGFVLWLGLSASTLLQHNKFEMKSSELTAINTGYQLALFLAVALVVGLFL